MVDGFKCSFWDGESCPFKKNNKFVVLDKCSKCSRYKKFMRSMEREEAEAFAEIERIRRRGYQ